VLVFQLGQSPLPQDEDTFQLLSESERYQPGDYLAGLSLFPAGIKTVLCKKSGPPGGECGISQAARALQFPHQHLGLMQVLPVFAGRLMMKSVMRAGNLEADLT
jgi:hypothetical protein